MSAEVGKAIKDAMQAVLLATIIMFIGAAAINMINLGSLLKFTFYLALFLLGISVVMLITSHLMGDNAEGAKGAVLLVTVATFVMFLGAAVIEHVNKKALLQFIAYLDLFLLGIVLILGKLAKKVKSENFDKVLKETTKFVLMSAGLLFIGGFLLMKYPRLTIMVYAK